VCRVGLCPQQQNTSKKPQEEKESDQEHESEVENQKVELRLGERAREKSLQFFQEKADDVMKRLEPKVTKAASVGQWRVSLFLNKTGWLQDPENRRLLIQRLKEENMTGTFTVAKKQLKFIVSWGAAPESEIDSGDESDTEKDERPVVDDKNSRGTLTKAQKKPQKVKKTLPKERIERIKKGIKKDEECLKYLKKEEKKRKKKAKKAKKSKKKTIG